jgi:hypothetical protein
VVRDSVLRTEQLGQAGFPDRALAKVAGLGLRTSKHGGWAAAAKKPAFA